MLSASALLVISFPNNLPTAGRFPKMKAASFSSVVLISLSLISGCLSTLMQIRYEKGELGESEHRESEVGKPKALLRELS